MMTKKQTALVFLGTILLFAVILVPLLTWITHKDNRVGESCTRQGGVLFVTTGQHYVCVDKSIVIFKEDR